MNPSVVEQLLELAGKASKPPWSSGDWSFWEDAGELDIIDADGRSVAHADLGWPNSRLNVALCVAAVNLVEPLARVALVVASRPHNCTDYLAEGVYDEGDWDCALCAALAAVSGEPDE